MVERSFLETFTAKASPFGPRREALTGTEKGSPPEPPCFTLTFLEKASAFGPRSRFLTFTEKASPANPPLFGAAYREKESLLPPLRMLLEDCLGPFCFFFLSPPTAIQFNSGEKEAEAMPPEPWINGCSMKENALLFGEALLLLTFPLERRRDLDLPIRFLLVNVRRPPALDLRLRPPAKGSPRRSLPFGALLLLPRGTTLLAEFTLRFRFPTVLFFTPEDLRPAFLAKEEFSSLIFGIRVPHPEKIKKGKSKMREYRK